MRKIIHVQMDSFFAAIEQRDNPDIKGKPVGVGSADKRRGVLAAVSREAKKYGIQSTVATKVAKKKCPKIIIVPPRFNLYKEIAKQIQLLVQQYSDHMEVLSLDTYVIDVSDGRKDFKAAISIARKIKADILKETELTASVGISYNKFLADTGCKYNYPDGLTAILPEHAATFIEDLSIQQIHGIGQAAAKKMQRLRIKTGRDLKQYTKLELGQHFGKNGALYYDLVRGIDERPVKITSFAEKIAFKERFEKSSKDLKILQKSLGELSTQLNIALQERDEYPDNLRLNIHFNNYQRKSFFFKPEKAGQLAEFMERSAIEVLKNIEDLHPIKQLEIAALFETDHYN